MAARVTLIVEAKDAASGVLRGITSQFGSLGRVIDDLTSKDFSAGNLAQSLTTFAIDGARKLGELTKAGAKLELVETRFKRLAQAAGTTSEVLLEDLRDATRGLYSDAELMSLATDLMALGLAKTHDEAVRLAAVASGLNMNMNQLVLTLTNMTTMRFDALGVRVDGFAEKVDALKASGMEADEAFREAFLQQAEEQLVKVGHAADTTAGSIQQLEATWANLGDEFKQWLAEVAGPTAKGLANVARAADEVNEEYGTMVPRMRNAMIIAQAQANAWHEQKLRIAEVHDATVIAREDMDYLNRTLTASGDALEQLNINYKDFIPSVMSASEHIREFEETETELLNRRRELNQELETTVQRFGQNSKAAQDIRDKLGELDGALQQNAAAHEEWVKRTVFAFAQARAAADGEISAIEGELLTAIGEGLGLLDEEAVSAMTNINKLFDNIDTANAEANIGAVEDALEALTGRDWVVNIATNTAGVNIPTYTSVAGSEGLNPGGGGQQQGGTVYAGAPYTVGERGPEPFFPAVNGRVLGHAEALHAMSLGGGGSGLTIHNNYGNIQVTEEGASRDLLEMRL